MTKHNVSAGNSFLACLVSIKIKETYSVIVFVYSSKTDDLSKLKQMPFRNGPFNFQGGVMVFF